ncbi:phosphatidylinositol-specific phospholipase C [Lentisphaerota bacterium ZTH]|nr:phosphatidylinositol-specific phospholipase C [Lentisphaerota bacterium]WET05699.1 phosphatidylinositol-specific phospholipase C [Lentisphaerota bacterium ZTH]
MRKTSRSLHWPTLLLLSLISLTASGAIKRDNYVYFHKGSDIQSIAVAYAGEYSITGGQPFDTPSWDGNASALKVPAGRKKTSGVANWLLDRSQTALIYCRTAEGNKPKELNFAFSANINIDGTYYSVVIGQGSDGLSHNNWWIGSSSGFHGYPTMMITHDGKYIITAVENESNIFTVSKNYLDRIDWMKNIDDSKSLKDISIPGTHDACTSNLSKTLIWPVLGLTQCQDFSVGAQLIMGIRSLDVRVKKDGGIYHGSYYCNLTLDRVFWECLNFLKEYPAETIIFTVKNEGSENENSIVQNLLASAIINAGAENFWTQDQLPALGQVRGKIVIINRMLHHQGEDDIGIKVNWPDNTAGELTTGTQNTFYIQDKYKKCSPGEKAELVISSLNSHARADYPSFIFSSLAAEFPSLNTPRYYAASINASLRAYLLQHPELHNTGWLMMDFPSQNLINLIIQYNFQEVL